VEEAVFLGQRVVVLGSHPGRVVDVADVGHGADPHQAGKSAPEFLALRSSIEDVVRAQHRRAFTTG
jgi:NitT/TauT family transport system ATP-binding protein